VFLFVSVDFYFWFEFAGFLVPFSTVSSSLADTMMHLFFPAAHHFFTIQIQTSHLPPSILNSKPNTITAYHHKSRSFIPNSINFQSHTCNHRSQPQISIPNLQHPNPFLNHHHQHPSRAHEPLTTSNQITTHLQSQATNQNSSASILILPVAFSTSITTKSTKSAIQTNYPNLQAHDFTNTVPIQFKSPYQIPITQPSSLT
jgi:hypothetical protein